MSVHLIRSVPFGHKFPHFTLTTRSTPFHRAKPGPSGVMERGKERVEVASLTVSSYSPLPVPSSLTTFASRRDRRRSRRTEGTAYGSSRKTRSEKGLGEDMNRMPDEPRSDWKWMTTAPYIPGLVASLVVRSFRALFVRPSLTIRYASRFFSSFFTSLHRVAGLRLSVLRPSLLPTVAAACGA